MKKNSLWIAAAAAMVVAVALAGCGSTTYFAGRVLPPSGIANRVMIAIQNPTASLKGSLQIVDAYFDTRYAYNNINKTFNVAGFGGSLPVSIQNMPEEQIGAVYGSGDGSLSMISYPKEAGSGSMGGLNNLIFSNIYTSKNQNYTVAAAQQNHVMLIYDQTNTAGGTYELGLPGIYRVSLNPGGSVALAFVQNSNYVYYAIKLNAQQTITYSGGQSTWPPAAVDCEPRTSPGYCLFQAQSPDNYDTKSGTWYGAPLVFDRPTKAVFSADGSIAYILNCGRECGGVNSSISLLPTNPMVFLPGHSSGQLPTNAALSTNCATVSNTNTCTIPVPYGASNALVASNTIYVVGQKLMPDNYWAGYLTSINSTTNTVIPSTQAAPNPVSISDGTPGGPSRLLLADNDTLWIAMTKCNNGERYNNPDTYPSGYGCLTMFNTSSGTVTLLEPYIGDATGIAAVTGLNKIYAAEGGQVYIYKTTDGTSIDNQYVTVTGTAWDVAYIDATSDGNNTVY